MSPVIRKPRPEELALLGALEQRAAERFRTSAHPYAAQLPSFDPDQLAELHRAGTVWVAEAGAGQLVGFVVAGYLGDDPYLHELDVEVAWGRQGVGRALIRRVAEWARDAGHASLLLATFADVPWNAPYYERLGFATIPLAEYGPSMLAQRRADAALGMPVASRVMMRAPLVRLLQ